MKPRHVIWYQDTRTTYLAPSIGIPRSAILFPYEIESEWPSWGLPLGVHSRTQSTCLRRCADLWGSMV